MIDILNFGSLFFKIIKIIINTYNTGFCNFNIGASSRGVVKIALSPTFRRVLLNIFDCQIVKINNHFFLDLTIKVVKMYLM